MGISTGQKPSYPVDDGVATECVQAAEYVRRFAVSGDYNELAKCRCLICVYSVFENVQSNSAIRLKICTYIHSII